MTAAHREILLTREPLGDPCASVRGRRRRGSWISYGVRARTGGHGRHRGHRIRGLRGDGATPARQARRRSRRAVPGAAAVVLHHRIGFVPVAEPSLFLRVTAAPPGSGVRRGAVAGRTPQATRPHLEAPRGGRPPRSHEPSQSTHGRPVRADDRFRRGRERELSVPSYPRATWSSSWRR